AVVVFDALGVRAEVVVRHPRGFRADGQLADLDLRLAKGPRRARGERPGVDGSWAFEARRLRLGRDADLPQPVEAKRAHAAARVAVADEQPLAGAVDHPVGIDFPAPGVSGGRGAVVQAHPLAVARGGFELGEPLTDVALATVAFGEVEQ